MVAWQRGTVPDVVYYVCPGCQTADEAKIGICRLTRLL